MSGGAGAETRGDPSTVRYNASWVNGQIGNHPPLDRQTDRQD